MKDNYAILNQTRAAFKIVERKMKTYLLNTIIFQLLGKKKNKIRSLQGDLSPDVLSRKIKVGLKPPSKMPGLWLAILLKTKRLNFKTTIFSPKSCLILRQPDQNTDPQISRIKIEALKSQLLSSAGIFSQLTTTFFLALLSVRQGPQQGWATSTPAPSESLKKPNLGYPSELNTDI